MADMDHSSTSLHNSQASGGEISVSVADDSHSRGSKLEFSEDEEILIARMFNLVGERWTLIAGRIPGRTAEEIEKYWTSRYSSSQWKVGC